MTHRKDHVMDEQAVKTDQDKMQDFVNEYNALCKKHGYQVAAAIIPVSTNHGTWELGIQMSIVKLEPGK